MVRSFAHALGRRLAAAVLPALLALAALAAPSAATAQHAPTVHVFRQEGCPHCAHLVEFLESQGDALAGVRVVYHEVSGDGDELALFVRAATWSGMAQLAVPFTVVGDRVMVGFGGPEDSGRALMRAVEECRRTGCPDVVGGWMRAGAEAGETPDARGPPARRIEVVPATLVLPLVGEVDLRAMSLPVLTVLLAALDGFNPCAMWTLVFLLGLLVGMRDPVRRWTLGVVFLAASAGVYFVFMAAWLNVILLLGMAAAVRVGVGLLAIGGGAWYLWQFRANPEGACLVEGSERRRRVFEQLRELASERRFAAAVLGIAALAFAVNLVELVCSAGIPAVYTQVLALAGLPAWQRFLYMALYIAVFMLDDLIVFAVAMRTLEVTGLSGRFARWSHLIGGVVLLGLGAVLIARPQWLVPG